MNSTDSSDCCKEAGLCGYIFAVIGSFLIAAGLVWITWHYTRPEPVNAARAAERRKALTELRASNADVMHSQTYIWMPGIPPVNHIVRMPIDRAMELSIKLWQNPAAARSNLIARVEKATAVPPPQVLE